MHHFRNGLISPCRVRQQFSWRVISRTNRSQVREWWLLQAFNCSRGYSSITSNMNIKIKIKNWHLCTDYTCPVLVNRKPQKSILLINFHYSNLLCSKIIKKLIFHFKAIKNNQFNWFLFAQYDFLFFCKHNNQK